MAKPATKIKLLLDGEGGMTWQLPKKGEQLRRKEAYTLLGMIRYAEKVVLNMLEQPTQE